MKITLLTQDEPFYLAENIDYLANNLPDDVEIVSAVLFNASPFGKKETFYQKAKKTLSIFGLKFFVFYSFRFLIRKLQPGKKVPRVLKKNNITEIRLEKSINHRDSLDKIKSYDPDLLISIAGNQIFKSQLINLAPKGCLNLHTALLPKYRGLMPSFWVMKNNEVKTGVSVFFVDEGIDSGPILVQKEMAIENRTQEQLIKDSKQLGMDAIIEAIKKIKHGDYKLIPNIDAEKTYFSFPTKEDVRDFKLKGKRFF